MVSITVMANQFPTVRLDRAKKHYGSRKALAEFLGITEEAIMNWERDKRKFLPEKRAYQVFFDAPELSEKKRAA